MNPSLVDSDAQPPKLTFTPKTPGNFKAEVFADGELIDSIPFVVTPQTVIIDEPASIPISTIIDSPIDEDPRLEAIVKDPSGKTIPTKIGKSKHQPTLNFIPHTSGPHTIEISKDGKKLKELPVNVIPTATVGQTAEIVPPLAKSPKISAVVTDCDGNEVPSKVDLSGDKPKLLFVPEKPGEHIAKFLDGTTPVVDIPVVANVQKGSLGRPVETPAPNPKVCSTKVKDPSGVQIPSEFVPNKEGKKTK
eukprot:TRINITY_DN2936_c0_g2_i12.p1 TRINITY_DN2936_c0_g2~~TRINITY_DN2936_c0_g2_i12.p1  ORF type:complete len:248 (+),score=88.37 TRINITY_DN2936_c0_g2_i12:17-760(+)